MLRLFKSCHAWPAPTPRIHGAIMRVLVATLILALVAAAQAPEGYYRFPRPARRHAGLHRRGRFVEGERRGWNGTAPHQSSGAGDTCGDLAGWGDRSICRTLRGSARGLHAACHRRPAAAAYMARASIVGCRLDARGSNPLLDSQILDTAQQSARLAESREPRVPGHPTGTGRSGRLLPPRQNSLLHPPPLPRQPRQAV